MFYVSVMKWSGDWQFTFLLIDYENEVNTLRPEEAYISVNWVIIVSDNGLSPL